MFGCLGKLAVFVLAFVIMLAIIDVAMTVTDSIDHYAMTHGDTCHTETRYAGDGSAQPVLVCALTATPTVSPQ